MSYFENKFVSLLLDNITQHFGHHFRYDERDGILYFDLLLGGDLGVLSLRECGELVSVRLTVYSGIDDVCSVQFKFHHMLWSNLPLMGGRAKALMEGVKALGSVSTLSGVGVVFTR